MDFAISRNIVLSSPPAGPEGLSFLCDLDDDHLLCGPDGRPEKVTVDPIFAKTFEAVEADLMNELGIQKTRGVLTQAVTTPFHDWIQELGANAEPILIGGHDYIRTVQIEKDDVAIGIALLTGDGIDSFHIRGLLLGPDLAVDKHHRNCGYGTALILSSLIANGGIPTWDHDKPGYSYGGAAVCRRAVELMKEALAKDKDKVPSPGP